MTITQDTSAPLVVVVGSTGAQGSSVIKALIESDKPYRLRGLTRDTSKPAAKELTEKGVEMLAVEPGPENKEQIVKAFQGADIVFAVTVLAMQRKELEEGKTFVDAAKVVNAKLFVFSGLVSTSEASGGKYHVPHFDDKNEIVKYARASGIPRVVNVLIPMYFENLTNLSVTPRKQPDGSYAIFCVGPSDRAFPAICARQDYGLFVRKAIEVPDCPQDMFAYGERITWDELAKQLSEATGKKVTYVQQSNEEFMKDFTSKGLPELIATVILNMYLSSIEFGYYGKKDSGLNREVLAREPIAFREWAKLTDWSKILN
ncbi:hypothetical protein FRB94_009141 [Tulasnella sp. JGI-2019a]|nr:hypothetical protein FRB94_009141 [Tulasnella sp. JGI-2019a]KAG8998988.1 hypothetical protein FRB93_013398 [Tulasnella sp. JGI-2019a]KAG9027973.1 hypothetical protein FRB95_007020 [Tulasnella sp. JGI-2019a]